MHPGTSLRNLLKPSGRITHATVRLLDGLLARTHAPTLPAHQRTGRKGEEHAYFYLRSLGYVMVARNYRTPRCRGEIDLIGWDHDVLCFVEVKTRSTHEVKSAEASVDRGKWRELRAVAQEYLRHLPPSCPSRFDLVSVYYDAPSRQPLLELFKNAVPLS